MKTIETCRQYVIFFNFTTQVLPLKLFLADSSFLPKSYQSQCHYYFQMYQQEVIYFYVYVFLIYIFAQLSAEISMFVHLLILKKLDLCQGS